MYCLNIDSIPSAVLRDAIATSNRKFDSCYVDPEGGCCITFKGDLSHKEIARFLTAITPNQEFTADDINVFEHYESSFSANGRHIVATNIYTIDGIDYRKQ